MGLGAWLFSFPPGSGSLIDLLDVPSERPKEISIKYMYVNRAHYQFMDIFDYRAYY